MRLKDVSARLRDRKFARRWSGWTGELLAQTAIEACAIFNQTCAARTTQIWFDCARLQASRKFTDGFIGPTD